MLLFCTDHFPTNICGLNACQAYSLFHGIDIIPHYLQGRPVTMYLDENLLTSDAKHNKVRVVDSPNFPQAVPKSMAYHTGGNYLYIILKVRSWKI